jgi:uncharacterized membrane protein YagU involved in acid resistance
MTLLMVLGHRSLPWRQRDPLPPRQITEQALQAVHADDDFSEQDKQALTLVNHVGYGGSMGALFGSAIPSYSVGDAIFKGVAFGCGVWAASYLGWLPAAGMYRSATDEPAERNAVVIGSHLLWGACLGYAYRQLQACCSASAGEAPA